MRAASHHCGGHLPPQQLGDHLQGRACSSEACDVVRSGSFVCARPVRLLSRQKGLQEKAVGSGNGNGKWSQGSESPWVGTPWGRPAACECRAEWLAGSITVGRSLPSPLRLLSLWRVAGVLSPEADDAQEEVPGSHSGPAWGVSGRGARSSPTLNKSHKLQGLASPANKLKVFGSTCCLARPRMTVTDSPDQTGLRTQV